MKDQKTLHLLIVEQSEERAEHAISVLRNAGLAVRPARAEDGDQIQQALDTLPLDMILSPAKNGCLSLSELSALVGRSGKDIPVVAITATDVKSLVKALHEGARDVVLQDNAEHLQRVVQRELDNLHTRRQVRRLKASNRESEKRSHALLDSSRDAITYVHEGMHVYANRAYLDSFGFDAFEEIEGMPVLDLVTADSAEALKGALRTISKGEKPPKQLEVQSRRLNGESFDTVMEFSSARIEGEPCTQIVVRDRAGDPEVSRQVANLRTQDLVTGLGNRQFFLDELDRVVNESLQGARSGAVIYIELDEFRTVVQQVGIAGADLVLSDVAKVIKHCIDEKSLAARFGDYVFTILNQGTALNEVEELAEQTRAKLESHISEVGKQSITLTCSVGVAAVGENVKSVQDALSDASNACAKAQEAGGNRVHLHNPVAQDHADRKHTRRWLDAIRDALDNDRFALVFQPIVSLHGVAGEFYEVLLRMESKEGELVPPAEFFPVAEQHDLMGEINRWVMGHAIKLLKQRQDDGHNTTFFVKLTPETAEDTSLLPWLSRQLKEHRLQGDKLVFEMPESRVVTHMKPARRFVEGIKQLHCGFALEQFGSGLNSFQLLKHLPADYLKIDRSFMKGLASNPEHKDKVKGITEQAHAIGKVTIAEFVEDAASMSVLWQFGVNFVQGNFLQEPEKILAYDFGG